MRPSIVVTLIVVGGLLVAAPLVADYLLQAKYQDSVVRLLEKPETHRVNISRQEVSSTLAFGCWLVGAALTGTGLYLILRDAGVAFRRPKEPSPST
jgi:hypothetical protein